jgi:hypothetical protein
MLVVEELISNEIKKFQTLKKLQNNSEEQQELVKSIEQCENDKQVEIEKIKISTKSNNEAEMGMT